MPLCGFKCPAHGEDPGRNNEIVYCLTKCSKQCASPHVLFSILQNEAEDYHVGKRISVTMLTGGCKRQVLLSRMLPYYVTPDRVVPLFRGRLIHLIAENVKEEIRKFSWELEVPLSLECSTKTGTWTLYGTADALDFNTNTLTDLKTLQDYAVMKMVTGGNEGKWSEHIPDQYIRQLNMYRYMSEKQGIMKPERLRLQVVTFKDLIFTGNKQVVGLKKGFKWTTEEYDIPDIPILSNTEVEDWIANEGDEWYSILYAGGKAEVVDESWSWLCKVCAFKGTLHCPNPEEEREGTLESWMTEHLPELREL